MEAFQNPDGITSKGSLVYFASVRHYVQSSRADLDFNLWMSYYAT